VPSSPHFYGEVSSGGLGTQRDDRPKGVQILRRAASVDYQDDHAKPRNSAGNSVRISGEERDPLQPRLGSLLRAPYLPRSWL